MKPLTLPNSSLYDPTTVLPEMPHGRVLRPLRHKPQQDQTRLYRWTEWLFQRLVRFYEVTLSFVLRHPLGTLLVLLATVGLTVYHLYAAVPKGFFPQQDSGRLTGSIQADQDTSFQAMAEKVNRLAKVVGEDPAVENLVAFAGGSVGGGGGGTNTGRMFVTLKDFHLRKASADQVIGRLRAKTSRVAGVPLFLQSNQDLRIGGRSSNASTSSRSRGTTCAS